MSDATNSSDGTASDAHATREVRRLAPRGARRGDRSLMGILLIGLGVLFLLDNLNILEARWVFRNLWPLLIMAWGAARIKFGSGGEQIAGWVALAFGGLLLSNRLFGWDINVFGLFWPLILIAIGFSMFFRSSSPWRASPPGATVGSRPEGGDGPGGFADQTASLNETAFITGVKRRNVSQTFRGGRITTFMGSVEIDLRESRMADDSARIDIEAFLGHVELRVPRDWSVESHLSSTMGHVEDRSEHPIDPASKRLVLEGTAFMGHVEIGN